MKEEFKVTKEVLSKKIKEEIGEEVSNVRFVEGPFQDIYTFNYKNGKEGKGLYRIIGKADNNGDLIVSVYLGFPS